MPEILPPTDVPRSTRAFANPQRTGKEAASRDAFRSTLASARSETPPEAEPKAPDAQETPPAPAEPAQVEEGKTAGTPEALSDSPDGEPKRRDGDEAKSSQEDSEEGVAPATGEEQPTIVATSGAATPAQPNAGGGPASVSTAEPNGEIAKTSERAEVKNATSVAASADSLASKPAPEPKPEALTREPTTPNAAAESKPAPTQPSSTKPSSQPAPTQPAPQQQATSAEGATEKPAASTTTPQPTPGGAAEQPSPDRQRAAGTFDAAGRVAADADQERPPAKGAVTPVFTGKTPAESASSDAAKQQSAAAVAASEASPKPIKKPAKAGDAPKPAVEKAESASRVEPKSAADAGASSKPAPAAEPPAPKGPTTLKPTPAPVQPGANQSQHAPQAPPESVQQANERTMLHSVQRGLSVAMAQRGGVVNVRLAPEHLGSLRIAMNISAGAMAASFTASTAEAAKMLQTNIDTLRESLEGRGLKVDRLSVSGPAPAGDAPETRADSNNARREETGDRGDGRSRGRGEHQQRGSGEQHQQRQQESRFSQQWRLALDATA
jgi:flagellar hook-length control protein FliK